MLAASPRPTSPPRNFRQIVWEVVRSIPRGRVMTYGQIAALLGAPRGARAVGFVLAGTPREAGVPCQRVVNRWGGLAVGYGWGGAARHRADLLLDGVEVREDYTVDLGRYLWTPPPERAEAWETENLRRMHEREEPAFDGVDLPDR
jgi:methylated-DNA-protein-cysteine methyltransferase-like protein